MSNTNPELQLAFELVQYTNRNIFLTGKAGTGKTTFLHNLKDLLPKRMVVVAPTGVAAINAGGVTIHSFFQLPLGPITPGSLSGGTPQGNSADPRIRRFNKEKINIIRSIDLLVIDEISMVRSDTLDGVDEVLRRFRDRSKPFGGVQLLMIGDLHQLAPVVKDEEWSMLRDYYSTYFFFGSRALQQTDYVSIELKHIYRQSDREFIDLLNSIRTNQLTPEILGKLNEYYQPDILQSDREGYIILTTHNNQSQRINEGKLKALKAKPTVFKATIDRNFPEHAYPTEPELELKEGAQVMFIRNDQSYEKLYFNGKIGSIVNIDGDEIHVQCPDDNDTIQVSRAEWQNVKYSIDENTKEIKEVVEGTFVQYPLKLAWAITIHKSQGLTFDRAIIDANAAFAHGQVYVALSRCRSLDGLVLSTPIGANSVKSSQAINSVTESIERNHPTRNQLEEWKAYYQQELLLELFNFTSNLRQLDYLRKTVFENRSSLDPKLFDLVKGIQDLFITNVLDVSNKFHNQLKQHLATYNDAENNSALQERVKKASDYFSKKIDQEVLTPLTNLKIDTDNKAVRKTVGEILKKASDELQLKLSCIKTSLNGFRVKDYLETRAKGAVELPERKQRDQSDHASNYSSSSNPQLYNILKAWRNDKAEVLMQPIYMVLPQKAIIDLTNKLPTTTEALLAINGIGKKKVDIYGEEIIDIIKTYCADRSIRPPDFTPPEPKKKAPKKGETYAITLGMVKEGKTIAQIAKERGLAEGTIEAHLARFVGEGELNVEQFVKPDDLKIISEYFIKHKDANLSDAREALGPNYSFGQLRLVASSLMVEKEK